MIGLEMRGRDLNYRIRNEINAADLLITAGGGHELSN